MIRKSVLALAFLASFSVAGMVTSESASAVGVRRQTWGTYYYLNGPTKVFFGPPVRVHSNAYDIGPYGPGYGWPFAQPVGRHYYVAF